MRLRIILLSTILLFAFVGCEYDNFDEPTSVFSGRVVYNDTPVGVRTNGTQLELWQHGYQLFVKIPIYIAQDGTFSTALFDGDYKLVRLAGAPWEAQSSDTISVTVKGNTTLDVSVRPYFTVGSESYSKSGNSITTNFKVSKISEESSLQSVRIYLGKSILTDNNKYEGVKDIDLSLIDLGQEVTETIEIPDQLKSYPYIYARVGVRSSGSSEYYYTQVKKIDL